MDAKKKNFEAFAKAIKELGYKVYITRREHSNYGWVVNEKDEIGYFQLDDFGCGITFSTIHKPMCVLGTGFGLDDHFNGHDVFTREIVDRCFAHHPEWANSLPYSDRKKFPEIRKYTATEFLANYWDKENVIEL